MKNQNDLIVAGAVVLVAIGVSLGFMFSKREPDPAPEIPTVDVADPTLGGQITPIESYDLRTATVLLDIRGGQRLAGRSGKLTEPGELLLLSPSGRLLVRNELDDFEEFERYRAAKPVKAAPLEKPAVRGRGNQAGRANRAARGRPNPQP